MIQLKDNFIQRRRVEISERGLEAVSAQVEIGQLEDASGTMVRVNALDQMTLTEANSSVKDTAEKSGVECTNQILAMAKTDECR